MKLNNLAVTLAVCAIALTGWTKASMPRPQAGPLAGPPVSFRGATTALGFDISQPLRTGHPIGPGPLPRNNLESPSAQAAIVRPAAGLVTLPGVSVSFNGPANTNNLSPADANMAVGPNHVLIITNSSFEIYDKAGASLYGPAANNTLWNGFGGQCQADNAGAAVVAYDQFADRWVVVQRTAVGPAYWLCVAVSASSDPILGYIRYAFSTGSNLVDSLRLGIWPDAYYLSGREFANGDTHVGAGAYALERTAMIAAQPSPQWISFLTPPGDAPYNIGDGLLPSSVDGPNPPPPGSPNYFLGSMDDGGPYGAPQDALTLWRFHVDFGTPASSTFTLASMLPSNAFDSIFPCSPTGRDCIAQPFTTQKLDILSYRQRLQPRLAYRNFGSHESLVTSQSVEALPGIAGIKWWEVRDPNGSPGIYQQGIYAPGFLDGDQRWMSSIAMDRAGNMGLGFSASNGATTYPSVRYTGRLATDALDGMGNYGEGSIVNGTGSQTGSNRWGNFSAMSIDPADDCTFWYVNAWVPTTSALGWRARIGAFKWAECLPNDVFLPVIMGAN